MLETFELTTTAHWKAVSHPLRIRILSSLQESELTNEEMAKQLGVESGKLYFHTMRLLTAGLIERAGTRQKGPITEKLYRATASRYVAPPPPVNGVDPPFADMLSSALSLYRRTWENAEQPSNPMQLGYHVVVSLPRSKSVEVAEQFKALLNKLVAENTDTGEDQVAVAVLMHSLQQPASIKSEGEEKT